jgi:MarR family transcriptional regulator, organic hydroperoxide resistance regulator
VTRAAGPVNQRLAEVAYELHANVERSLGDVLRELDLTVPLADVIWRLDPAVGPVSRRELADRLCCDPSNVTFLVKRLAQRRLVSRGRAGDDRRVIALELTAEGLRVRDRLITTIAGSAIWDDLTPAERGRVVALLGRCVGGYRR